MRKLVVVLVLAFAGLMLATAGDDATQATINVKGMTCGGCVNKVEKAVKSLDGVQSVKVNLQKGTAEVTYLPAKLTSDDLLASIDGSGFAASIASAPQDEKKAQKKDKMGMEGEMKMDMPKSAEMDQARAHLTAAKMKLAKDGKYSCCISPSCNFCAVAMNMCPCGENVTKGQPVCGECKGGWEAGYGAVPDIQAADVKSMPQDKKKMGYEMKAKMMEMSKAKVEKEKK